jgi:hypothetical protein
VLKNHPAPNLTPPVVRGRVQARRIHHFRKSSYDVWDEGEEPKPEERDSYLGNNPLKLARLS